MSYYINDKKKIPIELESYIPGKDLPIPKYKVNNDEIKRQMEKSICKIVGIFTTGTGFLCEIPYKKICLRVLFTCNHVLKDLEKEREIKLIFDNKNEKKLILDKFRRIYKIEDYDIIIIELNEYEFNINDYLKIDDDILKELYINDYSRTNADTFKEEDSKKLIKIRKYIFFIFQKKKE